MSQGIYSAGFVVNILVDGKMQTLAADNSGTIPFESEYVIRLQNKNSRRAVAKIFIDNENVSDGGFIINAYSHIDIERPVDKEFKFKLVSLKSAEAAAAGKSENKNGEKGTIRVEFSLEKEKQFYPTYHHQPYRRNREYPVWGNDCYSKGLPTSFSLCKKDEKTSAIKGEAGATVSGGRSNQKFYDDYVDLENKPPVIISLILRGWEELSIPILDVGGLYCSNCGAKSPKRNARFCSRCGTKLS